MDMNKGRFCPTVYPLAYYSSVKRTPFIGEVVVDDDTYDIGYWDQDENGIWKTYFRTKEIQAILDKYENDTTFISSRAFNETGVIRRFFYNQERLECWLDKSIDATKYDYFAIRTTYPIKGKRRYVSGYSDSDGLDYLNALIPIVKDENNQIVGKITNHIKPSHWYTIEYYDSAKEKIFELNYLSQPSYKTTILDSLRLTGSYTSKGTIEDNVDRYANSVVHKVDLMFNQQLEKRGDTYRAFIYKGQKFSDLKYTFLFSLAGGYLTSAESDNEETQERTQITGSVNTDELGVYPLLIKYKYVKANKYVDIRKKITVPYQNYSFDSPDIIKIDHSSGYDRTYNKVSIRVVGEQNTSTITDLEEFKFERNGDEDIVTVPSSVLGFGRNIIEVYYTERNTNPLVDIPDFYFSFPVEVEVIEDPSPTIKAVIPAGYVVSLTAGRYEINLKLFALFSDNKIYDVTEDTTFSGFNPTLFAQTQNITATISYGMFKQKIYSVGRFNLYCSDPILSSNNARVVINDSTVRILLYDSEMLKPAIVAENSAFQTISFEDLISSPSMQINGTPTHIRVIDIQDTSKEFTKIVDNLNDFSYRDKIVNDVYYVPNVYYGSDGQRVYFKNNKYYTSEDYIEEYHGNVERGSMTLGEIVDELDQSSIDFYTYYGYSIDGGKTILTEEQKSIVCTSGTLVKFSDHLLSKVYIRSEKIFVLTRNKPFLIEGLEKKEDGSFVTTGALVHFAYSA